MKSLSGSTIDGVLAAGILLIAYLGWRRGVIATALGLVGLVLAYTAAYLFYAPVAQWVQSGGRMQPLLAYPMGGAIAFFATLIVTGIIRFFILRTLRGDDDELPLWDKGAGACVGAAQGLAVAMALCGVIHLLSVVNPSIPAHQSIFVRASMPIWKSLTRRVVSAMGDSDIMAESAARFVANPAKTTRDLQSVLNDERLQDVFADPQSTLQMAKGQINPALAELARDPEFLRAAQGAGLLGDGKDVDANATGGQPHADTVKKLAQGLAPLAKTALTLAHDPKVQEILQDENLRAKLLAGETTSLLNDPKFNELASRVLQKLQDKTTSLDDVAIPQAIETPAAKRQPRRTYQWRDEKGRVHFSDKRPAFGTPYKTRK